MPEQLQQSDRLAPGVWLSVVVLGSFLSALDATVVNVSLSSLAAELHTRLSVIQWVTSGYLLALALTLPLNGWLVERIGSKRLYLICFSGFTLASALCALSWSANSLIGFRVLQGVSGGLMAPMAQLMIARVAGKNFVRLMGYAAVPILLAPLLGPVIAGAILKDGNHIWFRIGAHEQLHVVGGATDAAHSFENVEEFVTGTHHRGLLHVQEFQFQGTV